MTTKSSSLPPPILAGVAGLLGTIALIVGAIVIRAPIEDPCVPSAQAATARASGAGPQAAGSSGASARASKEPPAASGDSAAPPSLGAAASVPANAREARAKFGKDMQMRRVKEAVTSLGQLLEIDPAAPSDGAVRGDIIELAMRVTLLEGPEPDAVFDAISARMGPAGIDILYEIFTTKGGSRAAKRAEDLLKNDAVRSRGTPALRVTYELRQAKGCDEKIALFDRAKTDGDSRTLGLLQLLNRDCGRRSKSECCLHDDPKLKEAIEALKASRSN